MRAAYRLQLGRDMDFAAALRLIPYLKELGVSHLYLSPSLQARSGSTHGYDVVDPTRVSEELGGEAGLRRLGEAMPIVLDIVPNHMGVSEENRYWSDPALRARWFDVDDQTGAHRRFFDIDELAAIRQEDPEVFAVSHGKVLELLADGVLYGLRVDHPDGLADPAGYLAQLREAGAERVWVEKILHRGRSPERLRDWPVEGTVGYEFAVDAQALMVDPAGEAPLTELLAEFTGEERRFGALAQEAQLEVAGASLAPEVERLARLLPAVSLEDFRAALARLPVYRTYVTPGSVAGADREAVGQAGMPPALADALLEGSGGELVTRFQQTSPAVTAKGVEDTAFYRYLRLLALNEVGGDPERFSLSVAEFHAECAERAARHPGGMLVTQTHDTKRSGDARARVGALAGMSEEWREEVLAWREINRPLRDEESGGPDSGEEYLLYQTLVAAWPLSPERLEGYLEKAMREAKRNSSWAEVDERWEAAVKGFARRVCGSAPFLARLEPFLARVRAEGERSALGQLLLLLTTPGVPAIYQGDELPTLSLVDPDNRRPVDWELRRRLLGELRAGAAPAPETMKLLVTWRALGLRARRAAAFGAAGAYTPLEAGPGVCAFLRGEAEVLVVVPVREWEGATILLPDAASGRWRDVLAGEGGAGAAAGSAGAVRELAGAAPVGELIDGRAVALLERV